MPGFLLHGPLVRLCMGLACVLSLYNTESAFKGEAKKENVMTFLLTTLSGLRGDESREKGVTFLDTTELPAMSVDLSALNLTELVNGMLIRALKDSKQFFSLLSVTSHSSFAFHKFSVAIYNISNLKTVDPAKFPSRYCYCLNNRTNDLSDFTALLVDIIGNSTSYLTEILKSPSILSVSQVNESDCIFICVMSGKSGRNLSDFWEMAEKSPVINYTFTSSVSGVLVRPTAHMSKPNPSSWDQCQSCGGVEGCEVGKDPDRIQVLFRKHLKCLMLSGLTALHSVHVAFARGIFTSRYRGTARTSQLTPTSRQTLPRTSPPRGSQNAGVSALRSSPRTETTTPSQGEQTTNTNKHAEGHSRAPAALDGASPTLSDWATGKVAGIPWVTARRQAWASTLPVPWAQATSEKTPGGLPWETRSSPPTSPAEAEKATNTRNFSETPARTAAMTDSPPGTSPTSGPFTPGTQTPSPTKAPAPRYPQAGDLPAAWPFTPGEEPVLVPGPHQASRCPEPLLKEAAMTSAPLTLAVQKLNPCLMELCRFFQQCLCMSQKRDPRMEAVRYCLEHYSWFLKNATYICQRVKRVFHSHTLKQKCLENICKSV
ncbi:HERV-H LTR-associating protein 1 [Lagenorhynchus albirostris]|uniref:HERV-H LTR-associating protein 1 n=1 Tax=Lagenorhynchus albirostris TaxID=27610 RepID=UPI0028F03277|nr:HERV-H LTR-associating protein 1 [Lagenorhynchus albirostris]